jgi:hypothetical protein
VIPVKRAALAAALALSAGCRSSAPYTVPSAAINGALAVGASLGQRAAGGCYATCPPGTACNQRTGYCDSIVDFCVGPEATAPGCAARAAAAKAIDLPPDTRGRAAGVPGVGVSPETGRAPTMPADQPRPGAP